MLFRPYRFRDRRSLWGRWQARRERDAPRDLAWGKMVIVFTVHAPSPRAGVRIVLHMYMYTYRRAERYHWTCRLPAPISFREKIDALAFCASVICARVAWAPIRSLSTNCFEEEQNKYRGAPGNDRYDRHKDKRSDVERCARKGLKGITGFELHGRRKSSSDCSSNQGLDFCSREMSFVKKM